MSKFDIYYAYQWLHENAHTIPQEEYAWLDSVLFEALKRAT
jgi:hypothetical protein